LEIRNYERLSKLKVEEKTISSFSDLRPGDCIVAFSRRKILQLQQEINASMPYKKTPKAEPQSKSEREKAWDQVEQLAD
jgi:hypothetical protein